MILYRIWQTIACLTTIICALEGYKAVVVSPIVDLVGAPIESSEYHSIPLCGGQKKPFVACKRGHQLLFNELVDIVNQAKDQVCVAVPNIFYVAQDKEKKYNRYWTQEKHFVPLDELNDCTKIPQPLSPENSLDQNNVVLIAPYHDTTHNNK